MIDFILTRGESYVGQGKRHYEEQQHSRSIVAQAPNCPPGFCYHVTTYSNLSLKLLTRFVSHAVFLGTFFVAPFLR
ncbi:hypothetical protein GALL_152390 [mine drainage metagenome]|uniref:Uncharacterized protein n=1 Tax=mine drainage metagenome TaxID=410659 RepID=A0A1J5S308_9ZZZZ